MRIRILLFICLFGFTHMGAIAQEQNAEPLDESVWQDLVEDIDYTEEEVKPKDNNGIDLPNFNLDWVFLKYVFFFIVLGILVFFIVRYLITLQGNARLQEEEEIEVHTLREAEENPMKANLGALIEKLIEEGKFREATRAYFLLVLQRMYKRNVVVWKKPKTNFDYVREVHGKSFYTSFSKLTYYFELIWYGSQAVNEQTFKEIEPEFKALLAKVESNE